MTTGQRIAARRKELHLSQEALGEQLGVSRQSIYKWESDASLPEIEKLVALSRLFQVTVGWLLGVEDSPEAAEADPEAFTQRQEQLLEDILSRYQQAQPKPSKSAWDKWSVRILFAMCGIMLALLVGTSSKVKEMDRQYASLANSIHSISSSVNSQISSISGRVEQILKEQNSLTADYSARLTALDLQRGTATFSVRAVPRTYVEGMEVLFTADDGNGTAEYPSNTEPGKAFTAQVTCALTDSITLSAVFVTGDTRQTQLLDSWYNLYTDTLPQLDIDDYMSWSRYNGEGIRSMGGFVTVFDGIELSSPYGDVVKTPAIQSLRVGLFVNQKLKCWLEPGKRPANFTGAANYDFYTIPDISGELEAGDILLFAAVYTDSAGRQGVAPSRWSARQAVTDSQGRLVDFDPLDDSALDGLDLYSLDSYTF